MVVIFNIDFRGFWQKVIPQFTGWLVVVMLFTFLFARFKGINFYYLLLFSCLVLLIPIYKLFFKNKDEIYFIGISESKKVSIKWYRRNIKKEIYLPFECIEFKLKQNPFERNSYFIEFILLCLNKDERKDRIVQYSSYVWDKQLMEEVAGKLKKFYQGW